MHELKAAENIILLARQECEMHGISANTVHAKLGMLTTYRKEPLLYYYEIIKKDIRCLASSILTVDEEEGKLICNGCGRQSEISDPFMMFCPHCESCDVKIIGGNDLIVTKIEGNECAMNADAGQSRLKNQ